MMAASCTAMTQKIDFCEKISEDRTPGIRTIPFFNRAAAML